MKSPRIVYLQFTNPMAYPPLLHSSRLLAEMGWQVLFLGAQSLGTDALRVSEHPNISFELFPCHRSGWRQKLDYGRFIAWVAGRLRKFQPDWLYASDAPIAPAAYVLAKSHGLPVVYHEHDSPDVAANPPSAYQRFTLAMRRRLAHLAAITILPNAKRANFFAQSLGLQRSPLVVWNCPRRSEIVTAPLDIRSGELRLLYHGSISPERLPMTLLEALRQGPPSVHLRVVGYETAGHLGYLQAMRERAAALSLPEERLEILGLLPRREDVLENCRQCDIGLALMPMEGGDLNMQAMAGASNKPFDYLACGLPLLVSDLPDWRSLFVAPGFARACNPSPPQAWWRKSHGWPSIRRPAGKWVKTAVAEWPKSGTTRRNLRR